MEGERWEELVEDALEGAQRRLLAAVQAYFLANGPEVGGLDLSPLRRRVGEMELEWPHPKGPLFVGVQANGEKMHVRLVPTVSSLDEGWETWKEKVSYEEGPRERIISLSQIHRLHPRWVADLLLFYEEVRERFAFHERTREA